MGARLYLALAFLAASACAGGDPRAETAPVRPPAVAATSAEIELVETAPIETTLDHADVRDAANVWPEMIDRAKRRLDVAEFYASEAEGDALRTSRLAPTLAALERAIARGVQVRFLADAVFAPKYPATLARLAKAGAQVKTIDCAPRYGGVQHAKYFVVDDSEAFIGSHNFDWRALAHIQEIGVRVRSERIAAELRDLFETDWALSDAAVPSATRTHTAHGPKAETARTGESVALFASPKGWLPDETRWDLPRLVALLDGARSSIELQVLTYSIENRDKSTFSTLDEAIRRAAGRGVRVSLLVSHWGANAKSRARESIEALALVPNVEVRVLTIPPWSGGEVPFARVAHAKYLVVDRQTAWIGTSNWEGDYFLRTRNVSVIAEGGALAGRLARVFSDGWTSAYAAPLAAPAPPAASTAAARRGEGPGGDAAPPASSDPGRR